MHATPPPRFAPSSPLTSPRSSSEVAISASRADSRACRRDRAASSLTTTDVTRKTARANQFRESARVNVYSGGKNRKLNAAMLAIDTITANAKPQTTATGRTANR
jgi:hypothetical protein